jgi:hypothetical protein
MEDEKITEKYINWKLKVSDAASIHSECLFIMVKRTAVTTVLV